MKQILRKIQRVQPLIRAKKIELDAEARALAAIREKKMQALQDLRNHQQQYIYGVEKINEERQAGNLSQMVVLEPAIDSAKSRWHEALKQVSTIESMEKDQLGRVLNLQTALKSYETLEEQYHEVKRDFETKAEQKDSDELSILKRTSE